MQRGDTTGKESGVDLSGALKWRCIGPHRGGRVVAVAGHPTDPAVFYFGACAGGVWRTADAGQYWENISDGFFGTGAVGAIAVSTSDPNVIYAGTGESTIRGNVSHGDGVYRSTDSGATWRNVGLEDTRHIARIRVHPANPDLLYVAALGHAWGPNDTRGVYRSRDGGEHWERILFRNDHVGAVDLSMDPNNPRVLFASLWEAQRTPYSLSSGGPGSGLFKSTDGGDTWTDVSDRPGLPRGIKGKIGVAVSPARPGRVWALVEAEDGALFRSDDGGDTWNRLSQELDLRRRAWYYMHVYADPRDADTCWVLNLQCWKSTDAGNAFTAVPTPHGDNHDLWIDPQQPLRMIEGNDGGACISINGGASWSSIYNQPTAQFYHVTTDSRTPYRVYGSQQDNSAISIPSQSVNGAITQTDWYVPGGGESGYIAVRPDSPNIIFAGAIGSGFGNGLLTRYDHQTGQARNITVWPEVWGMSDGADRLKYRFQWTFPITLSPHDPNILYVTSNQVHRSKDEGHSWEVISPDLTRNDTSKLQASGGPLTKDNTGAEVYCTIFSFVESGHEPGTFWAGTDDGLIHISRDGGGTWSNITPSQLPEWSLINTIELSPHDPATAFVAATRYKLDDCQPYLLQTTDYGETWQIITEGIPSHEFTRVIRQDPICRNLLFAGTETGVYVSLDGGAWWQRMCGNLPVVPIYDLIMKEHALVVATHGRSFWILDDVGPLRQLAEHPGDDRVIRLFAPTETVRFATYQGFGWNAGPDVSYRHAGPVGLAYKQVNSEDGGKEQILLDAGENPSFGVAVYYYLPEKPSSDITLTFLDAGGQVIKRISSKSEGLQANDATEHTPASSDQNPGEGLEGEEAGPLDGPPSDAEEWVPKQAGMNRFVWNLRYDDAPKVPGVKGMDELVRGPVAAPGRYAVQLTVDGQDWTETFEIHKDPRSNASDEDLRAQFEFNLQVRDKLAETHHAIIRVRDLKRQLSDWHQRLQRAGYVELASVARQLQRRLLAIEEELIQVKAEGPRDDAARLNFKLAILTSFTTTADAPPTQQASVVYRELADRIDKHLAELDSLISGDIARLNATLHESAVPAIIPKVGESSRV